MMADSTLEIPALPKLPMEYLEVLEVLEHLVRLPDPASQLGAAYLAQSCRMLRASQGGKKARYTHELTSLSISPPVKMPVNLDYEIEVLDTSCWPLGMLAEPDPLTSECVVSAC